MTSPIFTFPFGSVLVSTNYLLKYLALQLLLMLHYVLLFNTVQYTVDLSFVAGKSCLLQLDLV